MQAIEDVDIQKWVEYSKTYTQIRLIEMLKNQYPSHWALIMQQIPIQSKLKNKLPTWYAKGCLVTTKALEQASSEATAIFKASLINGDTLVDISAGLGVDAFHFSKKFKHVISIDTNKELNELVRYNNYKLGANNITRLDNNAEEYLMCATEKFDVVYCDADRRPNATERVFTIENSTPNILKLLPIIQNKAKKFLLKLSPLVDLTYICKTMPNIATIVVVGIKNEVKEILVLIDFSNEKSEIEICATEVDFDGKITNRFSSFETIVNTKKLNLTHSYFYDPSVMLLKSNLVLQYANFIEAKLISKRSGYMVSEKEIENFFGRKFIVINQVSYSKSAINRYLTNNKISQANVAARGFVDTVEGLRKSFKLKDGGEDYLFFGVDAVNEKWMWHTRKS